MPNVTNMFRYASHMLCAWKRAMARDWFTTRIIRTVTSSWIDSSEYTLRTNVALALLASELYCFSSL